MTPRRRWDVLTDAAAVMVAHRRLSSAMWSLFDGGPEKSRFYCLSSLYFCGRLTGIKDGGAYLLSIRINNFN